MRKTILLLAFLSVFFGFASAQAKPENQPFKPTKVLRSTGAFAEVLLRRAELEAEVQEMLESYTEEYAGFRETKYELDRINEELEKMNKVSAEEASKLTAALGKLIVRKCELQADYWAVSQRFSANHPQVKRAKRKFETFEKALQDIL
ncbi:MAG: hypothetical protein ACK5NT_10520 [Pyrinomonadaceae bacterium]